MAANTTSPRDGENVTEVQADNTGAERADIGTSDGWGAVEIPGVVGDSTVDVDAQRFDDEPGHIELTARVGELNVVLSFDADEAEELAAKINSAAAFAGGETDE